MTKADIWHHHISDEENSNLSQTQFCTKKDIVLHNVQYCRKRFAKAATSNKPKTFIPVTVAPVSQVRLLLGDQLSIELPRDSVVDLIFALRARRLINAAT